MLPVLDDSAPPAGSRPERRLSCWRSCPDRMIA